MSKLKLLKTIQKTLACVCIAGLIYALICIDTDQSWLRTWMSVGVFVASGVGALAVGNEIDYRRRQKDDND